MLMPAWLQSIMPTLTLLLGSGWLGTVLWFRLKSREVDRVDFNTVLAEVKGQRDEAWQRLDERDGRIEKMEVEIHGLRIARDLDPFPNWVVDLQGQYQFVNREFERFFLEPRNETYRDVIGRSHADLWPPEFCKTLQTLDASARQRADGTARAVATIDVPGLGATSVTVHKFPIRFKGAIVAWAGYITSMEPENRLVGR